MTSDEFVTAVNRVMGITESEPHQKIDFLPKDACKASGIDWELAYRWAVDSLGYTRYAEGLDVDDEVLYQFATNVVTALLCGIELERVRREAATR